MIPMWLQRAKKATLEKAMEIKLPPQELLSPRGSVDQDPKMIFEMKMIAVNLGLKI